MFQRMREMVKYLVLHNQNLVEIDIKTSRSSKSIKQIYTNNKAVTIFYACSDAEIIKAVSPELCFNVYFEDGRGSKEKVRIHDSYHRYGDSDFDEPHLHFLKIGFFGSVELNEKDFNCAIDTIKNYEKNNQLCIDGKTNCHLSNKDADKIKSSYSEYIRQKQLNSALTESFIQAFVTTFLDKYLKGYLINQGLYHRHASWAIKTLTSSITLGLGASYLGAAIDFATRNIIGNLLEKVGVNSEPMERILSVIGTVLAFTKDPSSLIELAKNGSAAALGQAAAYQAIRALPKLKKEPQILEQTQESNVAQKSPLENREGIRRRKVYSK